MEDVKHRILDTLRKILEQKIEILKEKIGGVHESISNLVKSLEQINANSPILEELQKRWKPTYHILTALYKETQRDPDAPLRIESTKEMVRGVIEEHKYLIDMKMKVENRRNAFDSIKYIFSPSIIKEDNQLKGVDEWKDEFDQMISQCLKYMQNDGDISLDIFHTFLDGIVILDHGYTKFMV